MAIPCYSTATTSPMRKARYTRLIAELKAKHSWLKPHVIEPAPGHLACVTRLMAQFEAIVPIATLQRMRLLRITAGFGQFQLHRIGLNVADLTREMALRSAISTATTEAHMTCPVCGEIQWAQNTPHMQSYCSVHRDTYALFAEDFRTLNQQQIAAVVPDIVESFQKDPWTAETPTEPQNEYRIVAPDMPLAKPVFGESPAPSIRFLDTPQLLAFRENARQRGKEHATRAERIQQRIKAAGHGTRKLGVLPDDWRTMIDEFEQHFPNFTAYAEFLRDHFALANLGDRRIALPPALFVGGAGIGKTEAAHWLAKRLELPYRQFDMASAQSSSPLSGSEAFWSNSEVGCLFELLAYQPLANPIAMLDEIDKVGQDTRFNPLAPLYGLLEPRTAREFTDLSIRDFSIDASHVNWIATANALEPIPKPILTRMTVFEIPQPTRVQIAQISGQIYSRLLREAPWGHAFQEGLAPALAERLAEQSPRCIALALRRALGSAARAGRCELQVSDLLLVEPPTGRGVGFMGAL